MTNHFFKPLVLLAIFSFFGAIQAVAAPIYVVDMQRVIEESAVGKIARQKLEKEAAGKKKGVEGLQAELQQMRNDVARQSTVLSKDALEEKVFQVKNKERELQRAMADYREEFARSNSAVVGKIVAEIDKILKELATDKGYNLIVERDRRLVVYAANDVDISNQVLEILNKRKIDL